MTTYTHHAEYLLPGSLMSESTSRRLDERDPALAAAEAPEHAFCFVLYDLPVRDFDVPDGFRVSPERSNVSGRYYLGGRLYNVDEVTALGHEILASNMRCNDWPTVIECRTGNWQPFTEDDSVVSPPR